jgi:hypothetical protein
MRKKWIIWTTILILPLVILIFLIARYPTDRDSLKVFFHSGTNVFELLRTLDHYRKDADPRKYKASVFLIRNMDLHYYKEDSLSNLKLDWVGQNPELIATEIAEIEDSLDIMWASIPTEFPYKKIRDCRGVTADFLITHINQVFRVWDKSPFKDHYDFEEFCEFFLPYKANLSRPVPWIDYYSKEYNWVLDSLEPNADLEQVIRFVYKRVYPKFRYLSMRMARVSDPVEVDTTLVGDCEVWADWIGMILRSFGLPVAKFENPNWANAAFGHYANAFKTENGIWREAETVFDGTGIKNWEKTIPKIWLITWGKQKDSFRAVARKNKVRVKDIPPYLKAWNIKDISDQIINTSDIHIQLEYPPPGNAKFVYLSLFDFHSWNPVHWAPIEGDQAFFDQMGHDVMYLPVYYKSGKRFPAGDPFILSYEGDIQFVIPDTSRSVEIELDRVYPIRKEMMNEYGDLLLGGTFEGSNVPDFQKCDTLFYVDQRPDCHPPYTQQQKGKLSYEMWWQNATISTDRKYRFIRFKAHPEKVCAIGEIEALDHNNEKILVKKAFGPGAHSEYIYDGVPGHHYLYEEEGSWVAIDFGEPRRVSHIRYIPRDIGPASIHPGGRYQLFFWNGSWEPVFEIQATGKSITCRIHPNGLYLMENTDFDGIFRPFIYRDGRLEWY